MNKLTAEVLAISILCVLGFSSIGFLASSATSPASTILGPGEIATHGPWINQLILEFESDSSAFLSVQSGTIPAMEWSLSLAQYATAEASTNLYSNSTLSYTFDGIAFNFLQYPYNNTHFRQAIADLMDYATIQSQLGPTINAGNYIYNPTLFPLYYNSLVTNPYKYNLTAAMQELEEVPGMSYNASSGVWTLNGSPFSPLLDSRGDDLVVREPIAQLLVTDAALINLTITNHEITGSEADGVIYGPAAGAVISPGVVGANYTTVTPPVFNYSYAATTDTWGMYTFGWIVSFEPTYTWSFFNSQLAGPVDFIDYYNASMDYWTNVLNYANSSTVAQEAASNIEQTYYQTLPYIVFGWQTSLFSVNPGSAPGWTGFANLPAYGPEEYYGLYFTSLNVHQPNNATGGTYYEALHQAPTSLDPLYVTNWIWQVDVWQEVYDSPFELAPTTAGMLNGQLIPWMGTWTIQNFSNTAIGSGPGWYNPFSASGISNGQIITINFYNNDTWNDGVPLTAYDYNSSVFLWDVQGNAPTSTPNSGLATPPYGLLATYIPPNDPHQIELYFNSTTLWNIYSANDVAVLPWHVFEFFNASTVATTSAAMDLTKPYSSALSSYLASPYSTTGVPQYLQWLPNLEIGSGAFVFQSWNTATNVMNLTKNVNYYRSAWWASPTAVTQGQSDSFSTNMNLEIYNPSSSAYQGVAPATTGDIPITNATGTVSVVQGNTTYGSYSLSGGSGGAYTANIPTTSLSPGLYELVTNASYTAFGLNRTWYSYGALNVSPSTTTVSTSSSSTTTPMTSSSSSVTTTPTTTTSTTSSSTSTTTPVTTTSTTSSTTTSSSSTLLIGAAVVVVIIIIVGVAIGMRSRSPKTPPATSSPTT